MKLACGWTLLSFRQIQYQGESQWSGVREMLPRLSKKSSAVCAQCHRLECRAAETILNLLTDIAVARRLVLNLPYLCFT